MTKNGKKLLSTLLSLSIAILPLKVSTDPIHVRFVSSAQPVHDCSLTASADEEGTYESLTYAIYSDSVEIIDCDKSAAGEVVIPDEIGGLPVTSIGSSAFRNCYDLTSITIPDSVTSIGFWAFTNCQSLESITIPKGVTFINNSTFENCYSLTSITLPDSIIGIGIWAFMNCKSLESITIPEGVTRLQEKLFYGCSSLTSITVPDSVTIIDNRAFAECISLGSVKLSDNVTKLGANAFMNCKSLSSITIPDSVTLVEEGAFSGCSGLTSITIPDSVTKFGYRVFMNCTSLESITLPDSVTVIEEGDFSGCSSLTSITIPDTVTSIKAEAFSGCSCLMSILIPESVTSIGRKAFSGCSDLTSIIISENHEYISIGNSAFENTGIRNLTIDCKSDIGKNAFAECKSLLTASLKNAAVSTRAFYNCPSLTEIAFKGKTTLDELSVYCCESLDNIDFTDCELTSKNAFSNCPMLFNIDSSPALDSNTGDFVPEKKEFIFEHFSGSDEVGFINQYVLAQVDKVVSERITEDMSDIQKVMTLHDWVCENTKYTDGKINDRENHNDASVFMNEYTVCEGYARACNLLYNAAGIETYYVHSFDHAWNIVKVEGQYFHVDSTWDDAEPVSRSWFLKSDEEFRNEGGSHGAWSLYVPSTLHSFQKNILPECKYRMGDVNADGNINVADLVTMQKYLLGSSRLEADRWVLADVCHDGKIDAFDMVIMRNKVINEMK